MLLWLLVKIPYWSYDLLINLKKTSKHKGDFFPPSTTRNDIIYYIGTYIIRRLLSRDS